MSHPPHVQSVVSFDPPVSFTAGRKTITLTKKQKHQQGGGDGGDGHRPRISLEDRKPVHVHARNLGGAAAAAGGDYDEGGEELNLSLSEATGQRRRIVEVRQRNSRDAQMSARRHGQSDQIQSQASGFNTQGGNRRAMIILPKNETKMRAREMLMQMHPHIARLPAGAILAHPRC
jgi:hypothetical protein